MQAAFDGFLEHSLFQLAEAVNALVVIVPHSVIHPRNHHAEAFTLVESEDQVSVRVLDWLARKHTVAVSPDRIFKSILTVILSP